MTFNGLVLENGRYNALDALYISTKSIIALKRNKRMKRNESIHSCEVVKE